MPTHISYLVHVLTPHQALGVAQLVVQSTLPLKPFFCLWVSWDYIWT